MIGTKVIQWKWLPLSRKYAAITLFGLVFTRDCRLINQRTLNHELIHCQQQLEWLYLPFFVLYVAEWLWHLIRYRSTTRAYRAISFEREAYDHDHDMAYLSHRRHYANYRSRP